MTYTYALLDPRDTAHARAHNDEVFAAGPVYGIEVTSPELAARCVRNLDPQHSDGDARTAAIEAALDCALPPDGAMLATVRADMDSLGAMAVLTLRREAQPFNPGAVAMLARIRQIGEADREASGPWPGRRPMATAEELVGPLAGLAGMCMEHAVPLDDRVMQMAEWIETGWTADFDAHQAAALREAEAALVSLQIEEATDGIVVVSGRHRLAFGIGYRAGPVVVAANPQFRFGGGDPHLKLTVGRWNSDVPLYWGEMLDALCRMEPGWGGSTSIAGSPQGQASHLTVGEVTRVVLRYRRLALAEQAIVEAGRAWALAHPTTWADFDAGSGVTRPCTDAGRALNVVLERADDASGFGMSGAAYGAILRLVLGPRPVPAGALQDVVEERG